MGSPDRHPIIELHTGDTLSSERKRRGIGTELMTCPPNAFQTGPGVLRLDVSQRVSTTWGTCFFPSSSANTKRLQPQRQEKAIKG